MGDTMLKFQLEKSDGELKVYSYRPEGDVDKGYVSIDNIGKATIVSCPDRDRLGWHAMHLMHYLEDLYASGKELPESGGYSWY